MDDDAGGGAHGEQTLQLLLEQSCSRATGTLETPHAAHGIEGEFSDGRLELASSGNRDDDQQMTLSATLGEDGTLTGYLSTARGDMRFTARRTGDRG